MMLSIIWLIIGSLIAMFSREAKPSQMALAVALGTMIGLIPKNNLITLVLILALFLLYANLGVGIITATLVSMMTPYTDPYAIELGIKLLALETVRSYESTLLQYPFFAWMSLNNTSVLGNFILGAVAFLPIYIVIWLIWKVLGFFTPKVKKKSKTSAQKRKKREFGRTGVEV